MTKIDELHEASCEAMGWATILVRPYGFYIIAAESVNGREFRATAIVTYREFEDCKTNCLLDKVKELVAELKHSIQLAHI